MGNYITIPDEIILTKEEAEYLVSHFAIPSKKHPGGVFDICLI